MVVFICIRILIEHSVANSGEPDLGIVDLCEMYTLFIQQYGQGIRLLDKKAFVFIQEKCHASKSFLKIYPLNQILELYL